MNRRLLPSLLMAGLIFASVPPAALGADETLPLPDSMVAVGDSITQAASTSVLGADTPDNSWATGGNSSVNSHYLRLLALGAPISGKNHNLSVSGAKVGGLNAQMQSALQYQPDYLTLEIGGNDLCTDTVGAMTSAGQFRASLVTALTTLTSGSPDTHIFIASIPDAYQLWSLYKDDWFARFVWGTFGICQSLLANPLSTLQVDVDRRQQVRQRNIDFNTQLAAGCAQFATRCRFDGNAVFNTQLAASDVAGDYFHPSISGQAKLAAGTWAVGYTWTVSPPPSQDAWVGGLTGTRAATRNGWSATVTVLAVDANGPLPGASVAGSWSAGTGATACTTGGDGRCSLTATLNKKVSSVTFTVRGLTKAGWTYNASSNAQTSISLNRP